MKEMGTKRPGDGITHWGFILITIASGLCVLHFADEYMEYRMYIYDLHPGTTYQIRVVAKNGINLESPSEWQEFTTQGVGKS